MQDEVRCPKCRSNQITATKNDFSHRNDIIITCLNCGHQFLPGHGYKPPVSAKSIDDPSLTELDRKVMKIWASGNKLEAVKVYRDETGIGLKAAQQYVQQLNVGTAGSAGNKGCAGVVLLFIAGGALLLLLMH